MEGSIDSKERMAEDKLLEQPAFPDYEWNQ